MGVYCSQILAGIAADCQSSLGGIEKTWITQYADGIFKLDASGETVTGFTSGTTWYEYGFRPETSNFTVSQTKSDAGSVFINGEITLVFSKMDAAKRLEMNALALSDLAVVVKDNNGVYHAFGVNRPVITGDGSQGESGTAYEDRNGFTVVLSSRDNLYPAQLSDAAIAELEG